MATPLSTTEKTAKAERTCLLILGMHRSGTSALTRVLSLMGADLPQHVMGASEGNDSGHWEPSLLAAQDDEILAECNSAWHDWRPLQLADANSARRNQTTEAIGEIINREYPDSELFVLKDPRVCRMVPLYLEALAGIGVNVEPVLMFRNPLEVIASLSSRRSNWPPAYSKADAALLWLIHVLEAEHHTRDMPRAVISYSGLLGDWAETVLSIQAQLGHAFPNSTEEVAPLVEDFLLADLQHQRQSAGNVALDPQLRGWVSETYDALRMLARTPGSARATGILDQVRSEFLRAEPILSALLAAANTAKAETLAAAESSLNQRSSEAETARLQLAEQGLAHQMMIQERDNLAEALETERNSAEIRIAEFDAYKADAEARLSCLSAEAEAARAEIIELESSILRLAEERSRLAEALSAARIEADQHAHETAVALGKVSQLSEAERKATEERDRVIAKLEAEMLTVEKTRQALESSEAIISRARAALGSYGGDNRDLADMIEAQIQALSSSEAALQSALQARNENVERAKQAEATCAYLRAELEAGETAIEPWRQRLKEASELALQSIAERDAAISGQAFGLLKTKVDYYGKHLSQLQNELADKTAALAAAEQIARDRDSHIQTLSAENAVHLREKEALSTEIETKINHLGIVKAELGEAHAAYRSSTSWRLTSPLRRFKTAYTNISQMLTLIPQAIRIGGGAGPTAQKVVRVLSTEGAAGIRRRMKIAADISESQPFRLPNLISGVAEIENIVFKTENSPEISIIVPIYNQLDFTLNCLSTIMAQDTSYSYEVIVMDDCSPDENISALKSVPGLRYFRNEENRGFLRNCNQGAKLARGKYLVFLNNDTELDPDWLESLRTTFVEHENVGLVGSKLVYPDGRLQEAGGIVWDDASAWNWGRLKDPGHPAYNYVRDVDYVSGASIMIASEFFERLNFFDERYQNAYYEDTDLAMAVRAAGMRVVYQPRSIVIHHEGISSGTDEKSGVKRFQSVNKQLFFNKWRSELACNSANGSLPHITSDRMVKGHILIVDACTPAPDQDSGSVDMFNLIRILLDQGYRVHFIPHSNFAYSGRYTADLQSMGVECVYAPHYRNVDEYLHERGDIFSHVFLTRVNVAHACIDTVVKCCPSARRIFYTVDLHFLRESREAELNDDNVLRGKARQTELTELALMDRVHTTILLSDAEKTLLEKRGKTNLVTLPLIRDIPEPTATPFDDRNGVLFIGGYQHTPNVDAVDWLVTEIWPEVRKLMRERGLEPIPLHIYGSLMPDRFQHYACDDIRVHGYAENLRDIFSTVRLSVAPLRYGAGLKGKLATSFGYGVPVVGTEIAFEGVEHPAFSAVSLAIGDVEGMAEAICATHQDRAKWEELRLVSHDLVTRTLSVTVVAERLRALLDSADAEATL